MTKELERFLSEHGAVLVREGKHYIYRLPNNRIVTVSKSGSDRRFEKNVMSDVRRLLRM